MEAKTCRGRKPRRKFKGGPNAQMDVSGFGGRGHHGAGGRRQHRHGNAGIGEPALAKVRRIKRARLAAGTFDIGILVGFGIDKLNLAFQTVASKTALAQGQNASFIDL